MKRFFAACLFVGLLPACASAQTDSVTVTVTDRTNLELTITTTRLTGEPGDTVTFEAIAIDTITGDTIDVVLQWTSSSPAVSIDPVTGFATFAGCGQTVCVATVFADVQQILEIIVMREGDDAIWREVWTVERQPAYSAQGFAPDSLVLEVGEEVQLCAYLVNDAGVWFRSSDVCPVSVLGNTGPLPIDTRLLG